MASQLTGSRGLKIPGFLSFGVSCAYFFIWVTENCSVVLVLVLTFYMASAYEEFMRQLTREIRKHSLNSPLAADIEM